MLPLSESSYLPNAAGKALASVAWDTRKATKKALSAKCRESSHWNKKKVKSNPELEVVATEIVELADVCLDHFVERVDKIIRRRGALHLVEKIEELMPEREPIAE